MTLPCDANFLRVFAPPQYTPWRALICNRPRSIYSFTRMSAYLLAPQWQPRSPEQQLPGSASLPSGPIQVWVKAHQKRPSLERGTVGSGSDQTCRYPATAEDKSAQAPMVVCPLGA